MPAVLNMHSVKNRFLMRIKNMTGGLYRRCWLQVDGARCGCCGRLPDLRTVLPAGFLAPGAMHSTRAAARGEIMNRRRVSDEALARWFNGEACSQPLAAVEAV